MPRPARPVLATILAIVALWPAGCGRTEDNAPSAPLEGARGTQREAARELGFPGFATKNTTRVAGGDAVANAAAVARAVYSAGSTITRPKVVVLVDKHDWPTALAATVLMSPPLRAPLLFSDGARLPAASADALQALRPRGSKDAGRAQVVRVGDVAKPAGFKSTDLTGKGEFGLVRAIDAFQAAARGTTSDRVVVVSADSPEFAIPAAAWAAKSGDPILFTHRDALPDTTRAAIAAHQQPKIYVLGPTKVVGPKVTRALRRLGRVTRVGGSDPNRNAIAFARYLDGPFGWGVVDPGHGLVFARSTRELDAAAAAPLSASGKYGPLLLLEHSNKMPRSLDAYLLDLQPGYARDPVRGVYNHGWIIGDDHAISVDLQSKIDSLLEIVPVNEKKLPPQR